MYYNKVLGRTGGILPKGGKGTFREKNVPSQYKVNLAEPKNISVASGQSASAAPIVAVNKARFDNRSGKTYSNVKSNDNLSYYLDFRDSLKVVSGGDTKTSKPVPTHSKPFHKSMPLFIQACIDTSYSADNALYDNTSKKRKFSTPANGIIVPVRDDLFGKLIDDLKRVSSGQFPVHEEWFDSFGSDFTPSRATELLTVITRVSKIISFAKEGNSWLGKGSVHMKSIMNSLLIKNLLNPKTFNKQKYYTHMYHIAEQSYDDHQGRAIRGEPKPAPLMNAQLPPLPFPSVYIQDVLLSHRQESEAALQDSIRQADMARRIADAALLQMMREVFDIEYPEANIANDVAATDYVGRPDMNQNQPQNVDNLRMVAAAVQVTANQPGLLARLGRGAINMLTPGRRAGAVAAAFTPGRRAAAVAGALTTPFNYMRRPIAINGITPARRLTYNEARRLTYNEDVDLHQSRMETPQPPEITPGFRERIRGFLGFARPQAALLQDIENVATPVRPIEQLALTQDNNARVQASPFRGTEFENLGLEQFAIDEENPNADPGFSRRRNVVIVLNRPQLTNAWNALSREVIDITQELDGQVPEMSTLQRYSPMRLIRYMRRTQESNEHLAHIRVALQTFNREIRISRDSNLITEAEFQNLRFPLGAMAGHR